MSKKYKLKKWYPSLPKEWEKGIIVTKNRFNVYQRIHNTVQEVEVENNPEFWEPVVEKDYEILSFTYCGDIYKPRNEKESQRNTWYNDRGTWLPLTPNRTTHSVKRLSDGKVFTVGDKITGATYETPRVIKGFRLLGNRLHISQSGGHSELQKINHAKSIFTTEDGVDIFKGDTYYFVNKELLNRIHTYPKADKWSGVNTGVYAYFSTTTKAQEYIANNKVLFTTEDGADKKEGERYYPVDPEKWEVVPSIADEESLNSDWKKFSTYISAIRYISDNRPRFSLADISNTAHKTGHIGFNNRDQRIGVIVELEEFLEELRKL